MDWPDNEKEEYLYRLEHPEFEKWWGESQGANPPPVKSIDALRLQIKHKDIIQEYNDTPSDQRPDFLAQHPDYAVDRRKIEAYNAGAEGETVDQYVAYFQLDSGKPRTLYRQQNPDFEQWLETNMGYKPLK
jgi:hypothetical protein